MLQSVVKESSISLVFPEWKPGSWDDFIAYLDDPTFDDVKVFYHRGYLLVDRGYEGIKHASFNDLLTMIFYIWFSQQANQSFTSLSGCVIEKPKYQGASPDKILYIGENYPRWKEGEPRRINLEKWRVPDLVAEISDTILATDLDEKKQLYADLAIPEYWVIDIQGKRVLAFGLAQEGKYRQCEVSTVLMGLPIALLNATLQRLELQNNGAVALWFAEQITQF